MGSNVPALTDEQRARTRRWIEMLDNQRATLRDEVEADVAQYRELTEEQARRLRSALVESGWRRLQQRPDKRALLELHDPPAPDFEGIWARLVEQGRALRANRENT